MDNVVSVLSNVKKADIRTEPFPHIIVRDALPDALFDELIGSFPKAEMISGSADMESNKAYRLSAREVAETDGISNSCREFCDYHTSQAFLNDVVELWHDFIIEAYPGLEADLGKPLGDFTAGKRPSRRPENPADLTDDIQLDCQFGMNSAVESRSSVRGPHVDSHHKLFAGLLYFRDPEDDSTGGEFELWRYRNPEYRYQPGSAIERQTAANLPAPRLPRFGSRQMEVVGSVPYAANVLVMWLNTPFAVHGVSPRQPTDWTRRFVNFIGEVYGGPEGALFESKRRKLSLPKIFGRKAKGSTS